VKSSNNYMEWDAIGSISTSAKEVMELHDRNREKLKIE
jgi:hypothetical protein